jgi:hypothetical protein
VVAALGRLAEAAESIMTSDPGAGGPVPRFLLQLQALLRQAHPDLVAEAAARREAAEPTDPVEETAWAFEELAHAAAGAAVQLHPGGRDPRRNVLRSNRDGARGAHELPQSDTAGGPATDRRRDNDEL